MKPHGMRMTRPWMAMILTTATLFSGCRNDPADGIPRSAKPPVDGPGEQVFEILPPEAVAFNYPDPPAEEQSDYFTIAEEGEARCVIVIPEQASSWEIGRPARLLSQYLRAVTGATIRVVTDDTPVPDGLGAIHIGDTTVGLLTDLGLPEVRYGDTTLPNLNGYLVKTVDPRTLVIRGMTDTATMNGVIGFLRTYAGIRQYWPGPPGSIGDVVPSRPTLRIPKLVWRDWPYVYSRTMTGTTFTGDKGQSLSFLRTGQFLPSNESFNRWLPTEVYGETNPEYYGPKRPLPPNRHTGWQPCTSHPDVPRIMAERVREFFRENPDEPGVNFSVNDGGGDCMCDDCLAADPPGTSFASRTGTADRYVRLANTAARYLEDEFPDKIIGFLGYAAATHPPIATPLHPAIAAVPVVGGNAFATWDRWMETGARHMGFYFWRNDWDFILPKLDFRQAARRIRYAVGSGRMRILYMELHTATDQWPLVGMVPTVFSELLWDPRADVDALLDEYYRLFWGPADTAMRDFYEALEAGYDRWVAEVGAPHPLGPDTSSSRYRGSMEQFQLLSLEEAARARAALGRAAEAADGNALVSERVRLVDLLFGRVEFGVRRYWTADHMRTATVQSEADARRMVMDAHRLAAINREAMAYVDHAREQDPLVSRYRLFRRPTLGSADDRLPADLLASITAGLARAADYLRDSIGPREAGAWWTRIVEANPEPALAGSYETARLRAAGIEPERLTLTVDAYAARRPREGMAPGDDLFLAHAEEAEAFDIRTWFRERALHASAFTEAQSHSGTYSLVLQDVERIRIDRHASATPGRRYQAGARLMHNGKGGAYRVEVTARTPAGFAHEIPLASMSLSGSPGEWQELFSEFVAPPDTQSIFVRVFVNQQRPDARLWIDDILIAVYPVDPE